MPDGDLDAVQGDIDNANAPMPNYQELEGRVKDELVEDSEKGMWREPAADTHFLCARVGWVRTRLYHGLAENAQHSCSYQSKRACA